MHWSAPGFGDGSTPMRLLAYTAGVACAHVARPATALGGLSGTWSHPQLQGAGVNVQVIDDGAALAYWTPTTAPASRSRSTWDAFAGRRLSGDALAPEGMRFGSFRRQDLRVEDFGDVNIEFHDCGHATLGYDTPYGHGTLPLVRLTTLEGLGCTLPDAVPAGLPRHFSGQHHSLFASLPASAMLTARDEVLLWMDGKVRRGFFTPAPDAASLRLVFDDGSPDILARDAGDRLEGIAGFGATGRRLVLDDIEVVTDGLAQAIRGSWDLRFQPERGGHRVIGSGRVRRSAGGQVRIELFGSGPAAASLYVSLPRL